MASDEVQGRGDPRFLRDLLWDCFLFGLHAEGIRKRLLIESNLTFAKVIEVAQCVKTASEDAQQPLVQRLVVSQPRPLLSQIFVIVVVRRTTKQVTVSLRKLLVIIMCGKKAT